MFKKHPVSGKGIAMPRDGIGYYCWMTLPHDDGLAYCRNRTCNKTSCGPCGLEEWSLCRNTAACGEWIEVKLKEIPDRTRRRKRHARCDNPSLTSMIVAFPFSVPASEKCKRCDEAGNYKTHYMSVTHKCRFGGTKMGIFNIQNLSSVFIFRTFLPKTRVKEPQKVNYY